MNIRGKNKGEGRKKEIGREDRQISKGEINEALERIERNKAARGDGVEGECLKGGGHVVRDEIWYITNIQCGEKGWREE